jgi:hypothetical protein
MICSLITCNNFILFSSYKPDGTRIERWWWWWWCGANRRKGRKRSRGAVVINKCVSEEARDGLWEITMETNIGRMQRGDDFVL